MDEENDEKIEEKGRVSDENVIKISGKKFLLIFIIICLCLVVILLCSFQLILNSNEQNEESNTDESYVEKNSTYNENIRLRRT